MAEQDRLITDHPILGEIEPSRTVTITVDGQEIEAREGIPIAAELMRHGLLVLRRTEKRDHPRGVFCAIGRCNDCLMIVDGRPNVRTCVVPVRDGMVIQTQHGRGETT